MATTNGVSGGNLTNFNNKVQIFGLGSGLDVQSLINASLQAERLKIDPFYTLQDNYKSQQKTWGSFKTQLMDLASLTDGIKKLSEVNQATKLSQEGYVNVTAQGDAVAGNYNISVQQVATANKVMSDAFSSSTTALGYEGTLNVEGVNVSVKATMSLTDIAKEINKTDAPVDATVVGGHLFITSQKTGAASTIDIQGVGDGKQVASSDTTKMGVTITGDTSGLNSQYNVDVQQLATKNKVESNAYLQQDSILNYSGSFTINGQTINVATSDKLSDVVKKINGNSATGVTASISNNKLVFEAKNSGEANAISLSDATTSVDRPEGLFQYIGMTDGTNFKNVTQVAQDAQYTIDGVSYQSATNTSTDLSGVTLDFKAVGSAQLNVTTGGIDIAQQLGLTTSSGTIKNEIQKGQDAMYTIEGVSRTSETNTITDAVQDMTFELLKPTTSDVTVNVVQNTDELVTKVKEFVDKYNNTINYINQASQKEGVFQGESLMKDIKSTLRTMLYDKNEQGTMMFEIGIQGNGVAKDGTIVFDETKFKEILEKDPEKTMSFLSGTDGVASKLYDRIDEFTKTAGMLDNKTDSLQRSVDRLDKTIERKETAYDKLTESLVDKYSKLESLMKTLETQKKIMEAQLKSLNGDSDK